jgi:hypothetical protein
MLSSELSIREKSALDCTPGIFPPVKNGGLLSLETTEHQIMGLSAGNDQDTTFLRRFENCIAVCAIVLPTRNIGHI